MEVGIEDGTYGIDRHWVRLLLIDSISRGHALLMRMRVRMRVRTRMMRRRMRMRMRVRVRVSHA